MTGVTGGQGTGLDPDPLGEAPRQSHWRGESPLARGLTKGVGVKSRSPTIIGLNKYFVGQYFDVFDILATFLDSGTTPDRRASSRAIDPWSQT